MPQHSVLLVDDDPKIAKLLRSYFEKEDFLVLTAHDGTAALQLYRDKKPDILVLDLMLPGVNGLDVCRHIRKDSDTPILMLTARDEETDRLIGLELGADDYVSKPCTPEELVARLRAILRRSQTRDTADVAALTSGDLTLHPGSRTAEWQGRPLDLTGAEYSILEVLARNVGQLVSKQDVSKRAFGQTLTAFDRRIDVHMSSIRQKLGTRRDGQSWIRTVRGQGYQLVTGQ